MAEIQRELRDEDIRQPLSQWLARKHSKRSHTIILHELKIPRPSARVDIAIVNGELTGLEIKSDVDDLTRLPRQISAFSGFFDRVLVVSTIRHVAKLQETLPYWWGISLAVPVKGALKFKEQRRAGSNPKPDTMALLYALTCRELAGILFSRGLKADRGMKKDALVSHVLSEMSNTNIRRAVYAQMKARSLR